MPRFALPVTATVACSSITRALVHLLWCGSRPMRSCHCCDYFTCRSHPQRASGTADAIHIWSPVIHYFCFLLSIFGGVEMG
ncbi:hypothetical protein F5X96DRAFT_652057 [Biscogniauxia mediterranea]|nr:hypothetical protein F5X96DRAFT_652057 [Biscogniauxia mediterranea]